MNRQQAENILDAYVDTEKVKSYDARDALREVILDAMTAIQYGHINIANPITTIPYMPVTNPSEIPSPWHVTCDTTCDNTIASDR